MSSQTIVENTGNQAHITTDVSKTFVWNNEDQSFVYTNSTGVEVTLLTGTLMGEVNATGKVLPNLAAAVDGSQYPLGFMMHDVTVANGATVNVTLCMCGHVVEDKITLGGADTLLTVVGGRTLRSLIYAQNFLLVGGEELTGYDNQ
jgi:hypothetical protein